MFPVQLRGIDIAPDDSYFIVGTSGARRGLNPACDTITRFEIDDLTDTDVQPTWINFTGGDTVFQVVATEHAVYAGGHFRWLDNFNSVDAQSDGPGSTDRLGLAALDPLNGLTLRGWRSDRNPRGVGTYALISEPEGLYIGDDTDFLNGTEHRKLKFLPITNEVIARPDAPRLPTSLITNNSLGVNGLNSSSFNGRSIGAEVQLTDSEFGSATAAMFVGGQLFFANTLGEMRVSSLANGRLGDVFRVDLFGLTESQWALSQLGGMFFDYDLSRVYYTIQGDSTLYYRAFSPDGTFFGDREVEAEQQGDIVWGDVMSMDVIEGHLYFTRSDGRLYRADIDGADVVSGTTEQISGSGVDGRSWDNSLLAFLGRGTVIDAGGEGVDDRIEFDSSGNSNGTGRFRQFDFPAIAGEPTVLLLEWLDSNANLRLFVRDANDTLVASDTTRAGSPKFLIVPAGDGGTYTASVLVAEGSTAYTLTVNPNEAPPAPLADFEFSSSGTDESANGRFQSFSFDVVAGETVDARLNWDDLSADVRLFIRNENRSQVGRDIEGIGSASVSIVAASSGTWSAAVLVRSAADNVSFDLLVDAQ